MRPHNSCGKKKGCSLEEYIIPYGAPKTQPLTPKKKTDKGTEQKGTTK